MAREKSEREIVLDILEEREHTKTYSNVLIRRALDANDDLEQRQKAFIKRLSEGVIEREKELDAVIDRQLKNPKTKMKVTVRLILRMGVYQILYMDAVPDFAAVNESIRLLQNRHLLAQKGFVNAVLRNVCREHAGAQKGKKTIFIVADGKSITGTKDKPAGESGALSVPEAIRKIWAEDYGEPTAQKLAASVMQIRPVCIRFDRRVPEEKRRETIEKIKALGAGAEQAKWVKDCWYLTKIPSVRDLPGFQEGLFTVQDESSAMIGMAAGLHGEETVLDLCAAPGGKSVLLASCVPDGKVFAYDVTKAKIEKIRENAQRMHVDNLETGEQDATELHEEWKEKADLVLCDVPCSGLGVIARKRDIMYHADAAEIRSLVRLQRKIVTNAAAYVRPGGVLLYSTCTMDLAENDRQAAWIAKTLDLVPSPLAPLLPENIPGIRDNCLQLFPHVHGTDGFFMARFQKPKGDA